MDALADLAVIDETLAGQMKTAVDFRKITVRSDQDMVWTIVHRLCHESLDDFRKFATEVFRAADDQFEALATLVGNQCARAERIVISSSVFYTTGRYGNDKHVQIER